MLKNLIEGLAKGITKGVIESKSPLPKTKLDTPMPKDVKPPKAPAPENTVWTVMFYFEEGTYLGRGFSTPSAAETALMIAQASVNLCCDVMRDEVIQKIDDREAKVKLSKQWRDLVRLYPLAFAERGGPRMDPRFLMRFGREVTIEVVPIPHG